MTACPLQLIFSPPRLLGTVPAGQTFRSAHVRALRFPTCGSLRSYFLPLEPACQIGIQQTSTCASRYETVPAAVDDVCGSTASCASRAFFGGAPEFSHPICKYGNID